MRPTADALRTALRLSDRVHDRAAQIRPEFIRDPGGDPPLAQMLRGGRGGAVRLRVHLSLLWVASAAPHDTDFPSYVWATLLDIDPNDPSGNGARRVSDAISWLHTNKFVRAERHPGKQSQVFLLREDGSGDPYSIPGATGERYVPLDATLWTFGWMSVLSGRALALLLVLKEWLKGDDGTKPFFMAPSIKRDYGLSEDTWTRASRELEHWGIVAIGRKPVGRGLDQRRFRNVYQFNLGVLDSKPFPVPSLASI